VTDPPYGIEYDGVQSRAPLIYRGSRDVPRRFGNAAQLVGDTEPFDPTPILIAKAALTGAQHFYDRLPAGGSLHCWNKRGEYVPLDQGDADMVWCSEPQACRVFHLVWRGLCRHAEHTQKFDHPTQKPVALMAWMIGLCGDASCILDPYMGSGTTGVAAVRLGRAFIGIEIERRWFDVAVRRINAAMDETALLDTAPAATAEQIELLR
jgi:site-specific DNA-methyltransferase (adenine-specific)/modification methylase